MPGPPHSALGKLFPRRLTGRALVLATHNPGKVREIEELLAPFGLAVTAVGNLGLPEPDETGATFVVNARIKALASALASGTPALADDSGLVVGALGGDPGIYSARWAGPHRDFATAMARVQQALVAARNPDRRAYFTAALALAWPDGHVEAFEGYVHGTLVWPPRGTRGFGYDPMFVPDGYSQTFGELDPRHKHSISHRAEAFRKLVQSCLARG